MDFALDSSLATFFGVDDVSEKVRFQFVEHMEKYENMSQLLAQALIYIYSLQIWSIKNWKDL